MTDLSAREREVARLVAEGMADKEIARDLTLSIHTVREHLARIGRKLGADEKKGSRRHAITLWYIANAA
jgi:DNA-binding NarL/FixJ family response regulator